MQYIPHFIAYQFTTPVNKVN